jgi:hypothetical protein
MNIMNIATQEIFTEKLGEKKEETYSSLANSMCFKVEELEMFYLV